MSDSIARNMGAAARVMLGDGRAAADVETGAAAVRFSLLGVVLALVMDAGIMSAGIAENAGVSRATAMVTLCVLGLLNYAAAVATMLVLTRAPEHRARFSRWFVAQNWGEAALSAALIVPKWIYVSLPPVRVNGAEVSGSPLITIVIVFGVAIASFVAHYRLAHHVLGVSGVRAFWMVTAAFAAAALATAVFA